MSAESIIGFIGGGNMATSLIAGLLARGTSSRQSIVVAETIAAQRQRLEASFGVRTVADGVTTAEIADVLVLAVKPQQMADVARSIAAVVARRGSLVISIAAGIPLGDLARWLGPSIRLVRTMPNRPALVGAGVTALYAGPGVDEQARAVADRILGACGRTVWVPREEQLDVVTAVSGSGPAYFFLLIEAIEDAAIELGLDPETARLLSIETAHGAGRMAATAPDTPAELRQQVTSRGGTTAAALAVLEDAQVRAIFARAIAAAARRSTELAREFGAL